MSDHWIIRQMEQEEVAVAVSWAEREGWNPGIHDGAALLAGAPEGVWVAEEEGQVIGMLSMAWSSAVYGAIGLYLVRSDCRGRGVGRSLREKAESTLTGRTMGITCPEPHEPRFLRQGFAPAFTVVRCRGDAGGGLSSDPYIIPLTDIPFSRLADFDATFSAVRREGFLASWITRPGVVALGVLQDGHLAGYGVLRQACHGHRIGPLFAVHPTHAHRLYKALKAYAGPGNLYIDIPLENPNAEELIEQFQLEPGDRWIVLYRGEHPLKPVSGLYGLTAMELG